MLKLTCHMCKNEIVVNPYFHAPMIQVVEDPSLCRRTYTATVAGDYVCPNCGAATTESFKCPISTSDIANLALRREVHV
jgi:hypothetical protein